MCAAQKVEHYEIGSYGCLVTYAEELGLMDAAKLLQATLKEEKGADEKLTKLAENSLNIASGEAHRTHKGGKSNGATDVNKTKQTRTPSTVGPSRFASKGKAARSGLSLLLGSRHVQVGELSRAAPVAHV